jgi:hypothetical protein
VALQREKGRTRARWCDGLMGRVAVFGGPGLPLPREGRKEGVKGPPERPKRATLAHYYCSLHLAASQSLTGDLSSVVNTRYCTVQYGQSIV